MSNKSGNLIIIAAPSGTGKSTLIKRIKNEFPSLEESISFTTRPIREGEADGENYFFVSNDVFEKMIEDNELLEWAKVHGNYYGTSKKFVESRMNDGVDLLFELDVQGIDSFKKAFPSKVNAIFVAPPSFEELQKRLKNRATESQEIINIRLETARREMERKNDFDFLIINDDIERAYEELKTVIKGILA